MLIGTLSRQSLKWSLPLSKGMSDGITAEIGLLGFSKNEQLYLERHVARIRKIRFCVEMWPAHKKLSPPTPLTSASQRRHSPSK